MASRLLVVAALALATLAAETGRQEAYDPALLSAVDRFFAAQESENVDAYLALWSRSATRPRQEQLAFVFDSGDDRFSEIAVQKVVPASGGRVRVRVSAVRVRTSPSGRSFRTTNVWGLTYVREGDDWKLLREGQAFDDLAAALMEASTADEREQILTADADLVTAPLVDALRRIADQFSQSQRFREAAIAYERVLEIARRVGSRRAEGEALQNLANAQYFLRNFAAALAAYEQRLAIERERADVEGMAASLAGIATIRYSYAEYGPALEAYRDAFALQEKAGDELQMATTLISTGNILYLQGDFAGAIADYSRSRALYARHVHPAGAAQALQGLGRVFLARGDYAGALEAFGGVLAEARATRNRDAQGSALFSLGDVHLRLGNLDTARATFDESREHFDAGKDADNVGRAWQAIALTDLVAGRFAVAEEEYVKGRDTCAVARNRDCVAGGDVGLAFAQSLQEKYADAIDSYKRGIAVFVEQGRGEPVARAHIGLSQAYTGHGDARNALEAAGRARTSAVGVSNDDVLWRSLIAEARAWRLLGDRERALGAVRAAVYPVERLLKAAPVRPAAPIARDTSSVFALQAVLQAETGDAASAFESVERLRAHDLRLMVLGSERDISRGMTQAERDEERALAVQLVSLHAQLARQKGLPKPDVARLEALERAIADVTKRSDAQRDGIFERLPGLRTWRGLLEPAGRDDLYELLDDEDMALIELVVDEKDVLVVTAQREESAVVFEAERADVSRLALSKLVADVMQPERLRSVAEWRRASADLLSHMPPLLATTVGRARRVIVVPHDVWWGVPMEALPAGESYLADRADVTYAPSVTVLVRTPAITPRAERHVLAAGAPRLSSDLRERVAATAPGWSLIRDDRAQRELQRLTASMATDALDLLVGSEPTETALRAQMPRADLLHLALPFRINGASPLFSPLLLADEAPAEPAVSPDAQVPQISQPVGVDDPSKDGMLELREVLGLELQASLAILSDGGAMGGRDSSDDVPAVHWAWRTAGVGAVLVQRWPADEEPALEFLSVLHRRIREGDDPGRALRRARARMRTDKDRAAPFYWAGWLLVGDSSRLAVSDPGRSRDPSRPPQRSLRRPQSARR